jgi:hypothetical protein
MRQQIDHAAVQNLTIKSEACSQRFGDRSNAPTVAYEHGQELSATSGAIALRNRQRASDALPFLVTHGLPSALNRRFADQTRTLSEKGRVADHSDRIGPGRVADHREAARYPSNPSIRTVATRPIRAEVWYRIRRDSVCFAENPFIRAGPLMRIRPGGRSNDSGNVFLSYALCFWSAGCATA